jgi:hypothetical protein
MPIILAGLLAWVAMICPAHAQQAPSERIRELIEKEASRQAVSPSVALAFADDESGLQNIVGDKHKPDPLRRAYGPFQLQARFHLLTGEPLSWLLKLEVNIPRGIAIIKWALLHSEGDILTARFMYVCGRKFKVSCSKERREKISESWASVWEKWRPRAFSFATENAVCGTVRRTSEGAFSWPQRRSPETSSVRWFQPRSVARRFGDASRTESL